MKRIRSRQIPILSALVLVYGIAAPASTTADEPTRLTFAPNIRDSASLAGPALASGQLVDRKGLGTAGKVMVIAWPTGDVLSSLKDGDPFNTLDVAVASTDAAGRFTLRADPTVPLDAVTESDGVVNFSLLAMADGNSTSYAFSAMRDSSSGAWSVAQAGAADGEAVSVTLPVTLPASAEGIPAPAASATDKIFPCPDIEKATYNQRTVLVGEVYPGPHATGDFVYEAGSESSLGVGFSASGSYGTFSSSGTATKSSQSGINYPTQPANAKRVFSTSYQYKKYETWVYNGYYCQLFGYEVRPTAFDGAVGGYNAANAPTGTNCSSVTQVPATLWKQTANAVTWSNAVKIASVIGIDLSGRTGFNTKTKISFTFSSVGSLCGTNGLSWPNAPTVFGK